MNNNTTKGGEKKNDQSLSLVEYFPSGRGHGKNNSQQEKSFLSALTPLIRKSVAPLKKFLQTHQNRPFTNELCRVCCTQAEVQYCGVILCHSCVEFFDQNAFKHDKVSSDKL